MLCLPQRWREWAEQTAWEDTKGKLLKIEDIFSNTITNLPGNEGRNWLERAGLLNEFGEPYDKVARLNFFVLVFWSLFHPLLAILRCRCWSGIFGWLLTFRGCAG